MIRRTTERGRGKKLSRARLAELVEKDRMAVEEKKKRVQLIKKKEERQ